MLGVFHGWASQGLMGLKGRWGTYVPNALTCAWGTVTLRFPYALRCGEPITLVFENSLNLAATLRVGRPVEKLLISILPGQLGSADKPAEAMGLLRTSDHELRQAIGACFTESELGRAVAFEPRIVHYQEGETMLFVDRINIVQYVVVDLGAKIIMGSGIELVGPGVDDMKYRVRKAVEHGEDAVVKYAVLHTLDTPSVDDPLKVLKSALEEA